MLFGIRGAREEERSTNIGCLWLSNQEAVKRISGLSSKNVAG